VHWQKLHSDCAPPRARTSLSTTAPVRSTTCRCS